MEQRKVIGHYIFQADLVRPRRRRIDRLSEAQAFCHQRWGILTGTYGSVDEMDTRFLSRDDLACGLRDLLMVACNKNQNFVVHLPDEAALAWKAIVKAVERPRPARQDGVADPESVMRNVSIVHAALQSPELPRYLTNLAQEASVCLQAAQDWGARAMPLRGLTETDGRALAALQP